MATAMAVTAEIQQRQFERREAYERWREGQFADPRFATTRFLIEDIENHGRVLPDTWNRVDTEERTWAAEVLNAPHSRVDRFDFEGQDVIVKESDGVNPRITLREIYQNGLDKTRTDVEREQGLAFQLERDELFMRFYEEVKRMMLGQTEHDTIHMVSACPDPGEFENMDIAEAVRLLNSRFYNLDQRKAFDYTARRLPDGQLELSATRLDNSNLDAHAAVLRAYGHEKVSFRMLKSHSYGGYLSYDNTTDSPIEVVIEERAAIYDAELEAQTGQKHHYGRTDESIDAHEFFREHCETHWVGYKAYNELLAVHLSGGELRRPLQKYLLKCLEKQEQVGHSVLAKAKLDRLRVQLWHGRITADMAMGCRELLIYDHHATLTRLHKQYTETGQVRGLAYSGSDLMDAYAEVASSSGSEAAVNGETFAGCETATSVNSLSNAAQTAAENGMSLEQALRVQEEEAAHCLRIQLYKYTIRKGVHCPFCDQKVDARDTAESIECLNADCGTILEKATGEVSSRLPTEDSESTTVSEETEMRKVKLHAGQDYTVGGAIYRRQLLTVVGGAHVVYINEAGEYIGGTDAERLDAIIYRQLSAETPEA
jgi:hypothetical protein